MYDMKLIGMNVLFVLEFHRIVFDFTYSSLRTNTPSMFEQSCE